MISFVNGQMAGFRLPTWLPTEGNRPSKYFAARKLVHEAIESVIGVQRREHSAKQLA